jgi:CheY-like chemotaxis protein
LPVHFGRLELFRRQSLPEKGLPPAGGYRVRIVLVAEDEATVRLLAESIIGDLGYGTLSAGSPTEAQALFEEPVDLLFTDIEMQGEPEAGLELAKFGRSRRPELKVLYTSGRQLTDGLRHLMVEDSAFLPKPYTPDDLAAALQGLLPP